jgi:DNA repair protein RadC
MTEQSFSSFDFALLVYDAQGYYLPATADQILQAARLAVEKNCREAQKLHHQRSSRSI